MKSIILTKIVLLSFLSLGTTIGKAQDNNFNQKPWSFNLNFGQTLFWGDGNNDIVNPFGAYFKSDKSNYGYGLIVQKNINSWLGFDFQYLGGQLKGTRYTWSNESAADLYFTSRINQFGLNLDLDLMDIFMTPKDTRLFNFYVRGGGAYNLFNATEYNLITNAIIKNVKEGAVEVDGGWGVRFDISKSIGISFENIFVYSFNDFLDAHSTQYSTANDLFAYTSLGLTYRIFPQPKKPSLETDQEEIPNEVAIEETTDEKVEEVKKDLSIKLVMPSSISSSDTTLIRLKIFKYDLGETAKIQQTLPVGFKAIEFENGTSIFNFSYQIVSFNWEKFPSQLENIEVGYYLISENKEPGSYSLPGIIFYNKNGEENISQFKETIIIEEPKIIAENTKPTDNKDNNQNITQEIAVNEPIKTEVSTPTLNQTTTDGLEYRVQVRAIYAGKSSPQSVARQYSLDENVNEEFVNGYSKYTAGSFSNYAEAQAYRNQLRTGKVPGAFVVAYYNGKRMDNISEAVQMEGKPSLSKPTDVSTATMLQKGISYSIQVAASNRQLSATSIKNQFGIDQDVIMTTHNGLFKYVIGSFNTYEEANTVLNSIRGKVTDAFLVKYINGIRE